MSDPTPTNEQQDARVFDQAPYLARALNWASIDALANTPDYVLAEKLTGCPYLDSMLRAYLAAVPAAAQDERAVDMARAEEWVREAIENAIPDDLPGWRGRYTEKAVLGVMAVLTAALAASPAPVVSGADVERAVRNWRFEHYDGPDGEEVHMGSCVLVEDLGHVLAALGITVADAPAADDEGGQE